MQTRYSWMDEWMDGQGGSGTVENRRFMKSEQRGYRELRTGRKALAIVGSLFVVLESLRIILRVIGSHLKT